jgi:ferredoxin
MSYVVTSECIFCGACVAACEFGAVKEGETQAIIDVALCVECGLCAASCPFKAIVFEEEQALVILD